MHTSRALGKYLNAYQIKTRALRGTRLYTSVSSNMENFQYVILGGGNASGYAAKEIVTKKGSESAGKVCIISDEPVCLLLH